MHTARKLMLAAIAAVLVAACHEVPTEPADPAIDEFDPSIHSAYVGVEESGEDDDLAAHRVLFTFSAESIR